MEENEQMEQFTDLMEKKGHKGLICGVLVVLVLGLLAFGYFYKNKPEIVFKIAANKTFKSFKIEDLAKIKTDGDLAFYVNVNGKSELVTDEIKEVFNVLNNMLFKFSVYEDLDKKIYKLDMSADYNKKELLNIGAYYEDNKVYLDLKDLYDKIIYDEVKITDELDIDKNDVKVLIEEYFAALDKGLVKAKYEKEKVELDGSKAIKNKLIINNDNINEVYKTIVDYLANSDKFMKALANISDEKEADLKKELTQDIDIPKLEGDIVISLYTKGFNNKVFKVSAGINELEILSVNEKSRDNYEVVMNADGIELKCNIKSENDKKVELKCSTAIEKLEIGYTMNVNVDKNYKFEKPKYEENKLIKFSDIKEEDSEKIMKNLAEKDAIEELSDVFESMMKQISPEIEIEPEEEIQIID